MRLPQLRITMRRLMIVVMAAALLLGGYVVMTRLLDRAESFRQQARFHATEEHAILNSVADESGVELLDSKALAELSTLNISYHAELRRKYKRAAREPWRTLIPDGPDPISSRIKNIPGFHSKKIRVGFEIRSPF